MIIVYAGRRAHSLPQSHDLADRLHRLFSVWQPRSIVGAAADGSDLLVLEAALSQREPPLVHLVLPTTLEVFQQTSVAHDWRERFCCAVRRVIELGGIVEPLNEPDGEDAYRAANAKMVEVAHALAVDSTIVDERVTALLIATPGQGAMVVDLDERIRHHGIAAQRLDPSASFADRQVPPVGHRPERPTPNS